MPTVAVEGQFRFVVNTRENGFEPPTCMSGLAMRTCAALS